MTTVVCAEVVDRIKVESASEEGAQSMESNLYSISAVHRLTGKARSTIAKHIKDGKLSCTLSGDGKKMIEASELVRVYGNFLVLDADGKLKPKTSKSEKMNPMESTQGGGAFERLLEIEKNERERERSQLEKTIEHLRSDLEKSQERESRATLLLEHQTKDSDRWSLQMAEIEKRIASQEHEVKRYRRAWADERSKTIWQRLFR